MARPGAGAPPTERRVRANGIEQACFEWGAEQRGRGPSVLLAHATGFHARCWDPVVAHLGPRHVIAVDLRSHGRSEQTPIAHWSVFGRDLAELVRALDLRDVLGVGHSMGGHASVDAAAALPERFRGLVLIDPVILPPEVYGPAEWEIPSLEGGEHPTAKRKARFASPEEMVERFRDRDPYRLFHPDALRAYCQHGLLPAADGDGLELACPPALEARVYMTSRTNGAIYESIRSLDVPVLILRARAAGEARGAMDFASSPTGPDLVKAFRNARERYLPEHTHFLPMEAPERVAGWIAAEADDGFRAES